LKEENHMKRCSECDREGLLKTTEPDTLTVAGRSFTAAVPAWHCEACGKTYLDGPSLGDFELAVAREIATQGPASGETFRFMRKSIGMRAADLAELLDVTPETVSRWETGKLDVARAAWATLADVVVEHAEGASRMLDRLRTLREPKKLAKALRLELPRLALGDHSTPRR
jgi:putative zinc finger/helix-turn-helix YgiT family protein